MELLINMKPMVIHNREELMIARDTAEISKKSKVIDE
jgi:acetate kinase